MRSKAAVKQFTAVCFSIESSWPGADPAISSRTADTRVKPAYDD